MSTLPRCFWLRLAVEFRVRIKWKLTLSPIPLAEVSLPNLFVTLQSQGHDVFPTMERSATLIARNDTMILVSLFRGGCCSHLVYALTVNSTAALQTPLLALRHSQAACGGRMLVFLHSVCPARNFLQNTSHFYFPLFHPPIRFFPCSLSLVA